MPLTDGIPGPSLAPLPISPQLEVECGGFFFLPIPKAQSVLGGSLRDRREPSQGLPGRQTEKVITAPLLSTQGLDVFSQRPHLCKATPTRFLIRMKCENAHAAQRGSTGSHSLELVHPVVGCQLGKQRAALRPRKFEWGRDCRGNS